METPTKCKKENAPEEIPVLNKTVEVSFQNSNTESCKILKGNNEIDYLNSDEKDTFRVELCQEDGSKTTIVIEEEHSQERSQEEEVMDGDHSDGSASIILLPSDLSEESSIIHTETANILKSHSVVDKTKELCKTETGNVAESNSDDAVEGISDQEPVVTKTSEDCETNENGSGNCESSSSTKTSQEADFTLNISSPRTKMKHQGRFTSEEVTILQTFKGHTPNPSEEEIERLSTQLNIIPMRIESFFTTDGYDGNTKLKSLAIEDSLGSSTLSLSSSTPKATRDPESTLNISSSRTKMKSQGRFTTEEVTILHTFKGHTPNPSQVEIDRLSTQLNIIPTRIESFFTTSDTTRIEKNKKILGALSKKELEVLKRFVLNVTILLLCLSVYIEPFTHKKLTIQSHSYTPRSL